MTNKKQLKITQLFRKGVSQIPEDCDELQEEIQQLEQRLKEKQDDLFQLQRNSHKRHIKSPKKTKSEVFVRPEKLVLTNSVETLQRKLELMSMLSGIEVQSYVVDKHCTIVYHMQHNSEHILKHGLRIDMNDDVNEVSKCSLPLGFNLSAVLDGFNNVMLPECLVSIRKALVAYYDRLEQFEQLKKIIKMEAQLFKILDGSHIEVTFTAKSEHEADDEQIGVTLMLDYRVYDIRPKQISFVESDMPEGAVDILKDQCAVFKKKSLYKAFREAFIDGNGTYVMVQQVGAPRMMQRGRGKPKPVNNQHYNNDDTFHPEDCSASDDDVDDQ